MLWSWTPVVPASRLVLPSLSRFPGLGHTCSATTERRVCRGSTSFTQDFALRPAHSLSTLRGPPRSGAARKTRYRESARKSQLEAAPPVALFPRAGLGRVVPTLSLPLAGDSLPSHMRVKLPPRCERRATFASKLVAPSAGARNRAQRSGRQRLARRRAQSRQVSWGRGEGSRRSPFPFRRWWPANDLFGKPGPVALLLGKVHWRLPWWLGSFEFGVSPR